MGGSHLTDTLKLGVFNLGLYITATSVYGEVTLNEKVRDLNATLTHLILTGMRYERRSRLPIGQFGKLNSFQKLILISGVG